MASQLGLIWPHLTLAWVWDQDGKVRLANSLSLKLSALRPPSRLRRSFAWTSGLEMLACNAKQQLLVTCLDKSLHITVGEGPLWAYLFPTLKRHKCMQHSPSIPCDCGVCWQFICNCSKGGTT